MFGADYIASTQIIYCYSYRNTFFELKLDKHKSWQGMTLTLTYAWPNPVPTLMGFISSAVILCVPPKSNPLLVPNLSIFTLIENISDSCRPQMLAIQEDTPLKILRYP